MLHKSNKMDYTVVKSFGVNSLLNCLGKIHDRVAADMLRD